MKQLKTIIGAVALFVAALFILNVLVWLPYNVWRIKHPDEPMWHYTDKQ